MSAAVVFAGHANARPVDAPLQAASAVCPTDKHAPAVTPRVIIDAKGGPTIGTMQYQNGGGLKHKEVALTFDDGPDPKTTPRILDILDKHCIKATFFMVGVYAKARPDLVREVARRGHVIGTHTNTHPNNLRHLSETRAKAEITKGFDAVRQALVGAPAAERAALAPFFRFPGLNDKKSLITWLGEQDIATLSCSFGADDWKRINADSVYRRGISAIESEGRGILILHDTKPHTADMLSRFIVTLQKRGYSFVQLAPKPQHRSLADTSSDMRTTLP
ncbi:MAG: polysaccharide deacetylase family protein [Parvibaculum sp.]|nr:polysaccharide deacetylase family protein [Parvibaculum sp.]